MKLEYLRRGIFRIIPFKGGIAASPTIEAGPLACIANLTRRAVRRYFGLTRERRLIQLMSIDCSRCIVREVTEA